MREQDGNALERVVNTLCAGGLRVPAAHVYADSVVQLERSALWIEGSPAVGKRIAFLAAKDDPLLERFGGETGVCDERWVVKRGKLDDPNARALRRTLDWLRPRPLGLATSAGFGDRLGLATPGHARALRSVLDEAPGREVAPIFAQQSIREMTRTGRSPEDVMTDATFGAFQAGWRGGLGADADHLKQPKEIDRCVAAGFTFFTIDPGDHVDGAADTDPPSAIQAKLERLPWDALESSADDLVNRYAGRTEDLGDRRIELDAESIRRAAVKYGRAIAHVVNMSRHLESHDVPHELEISVDETETPTSLAEHIIIARELKRLGVRWVSLAPRFVGRFEKGIDYIGDLSELERDLAGHAAIARALGPYKLSLHSGSDKFSVYPLIREATGGVVHLKTAGTSYLEALRAIARLDVDLLRRIGDFAQSRYERDRASYHVSAQLERVPPMTSLSDADLPGLLEDNHARQVLHVTFGSCLDAFGEEIKATLRDHESAYEDTLERHFKRHLEPFARTMSRA